jgi:hypothetical protein
MYRDFYATMAQVFPVLLLAFVWESRFLERISHEARLTRRHDPSGVLFWTKPRVRVYLLLVTSVVVVNIMVCVGELAGLVPDRLVTRVFLIGGLALMLGTLMTRIAVDVISATRTAPPPSNEPTADPEESEEGEEGEEGEDSGTAETATDPAAA